MQYPNKALVFIERYYKKERTSETNEREKKTIQLTFMKL